MGDELTLLLEVFHKIEKAGGQATLSVATVGGKTKVKLEIATNPAPPTGSTSSSSTPTATSTAPGGERRHRCRRRHRGPAAVARSQARAAAHQASLAAAKVGTAAVLPPPPPPPPPPAAARLIKVVGRGEKRVSTFSQLDGQDDATSPSPPSVDPSFAFKAMSARSVCMIPRDLFGRKLGCQTSPT